MLTWAQMNSFVTHPVTLIVLTLAAAKAGAIISKRWALRRDSKELIDALHDYVLPLFEPPKPGQEDITLPTKFDNLSKSIAEVRGQVFPNHGSSLNDRVTTLEGGQARMETSVTWLGDALEAVAAASGTALPVRPPRPVA